MSELHTYRVEWSEGFGMPRDFRNVKAFTAADAVTQMSQGGCRVHNVEPLPDAPERPARREWATIPVVGVNLTPLDGTGRAFTPSDRAEALEEELRLRTRERDHAREAAEDHFEEVRAFVDAITGSPDPGNHTSPGAAARMARETREERDRLRGRVETQVAELKRLREERDRLRSERDALACAALGTDDKPGFQVFKGDVDAVIKEIRETRERAKNRHDTLFEISRIVWPGADPFFTHADLVEAVRKMGAERTALCAQVERQVIALRDGQRDKADLRSNIQTIGEERDALQKRIEAAKARIHAHPWNAAPSAFQDHLLAILEGREP